MMHTAECTVTVRFTDEEVIESLVDDEIITEEEAETYTPTDEQLRDYAWRLIDADDGEYGHVSVD